MKAAEKWRQYQRAMGSARRHYDVGGEDSYYCWFYLLIAAEVNWTPMPSNRQKEQRKLASQLRNITGMVGQARQLRSTGNGMLMYRLDSVIRELLEIERSIRHLMKNIKDRIPG